MSEKSNIDVSIIIVCMNNLSNLYPCLNSIYKYTNVKYEVLVVAYLFSKENLEKAKNDYSWVNFIESNEIRGFSENNNLALRQVQGKYCFILNDDTYFTMPVIDNLIESFEKTPNCSIISPSIYFPNGKLQMCGRTKLTGWTWFLSTLHLFNEQTVKSSYTNKKDIFQTYNILGAAFLIPTSLFMQLGWFDENYFFCPEDIALSTKANKLGYKVFVDERIKLIHACGGTWSNTITATHPAALRGELMFYSNNNSFKYFLLGSWAFIINLIGIIYLTIRSLHKYDNFRKLCILYKWHNLNSIFTNKTPKEIFTKYYIKLKSK